MAESKNNKIFHPDNYDPDEPRQPGKVITKSEPVTHKENKPKPKIVERLYLAFWSTKKRRKLTVICSFVIIILISVILGWYMGSNKTKKENDAYKSATAQYQLESKNQNYGKAIIALQNYLKNNSSNKRHRAFIQFDIASSYVALNDYDNAQKWAEIALANNVNFDYTSYLIIGDIYKKQSNNSQAVKYYKKAVDLMKLEVKKDPFIQPRIATTQFTIKKLSKSNK